MWLAVEGDRAKVAGCAFTTILYCRVGLFPPAFEARIVKSNVPATVGVPESTPVVEFKVIPFGKVPAVILHEVAPAAVNV
jgi:hypothetical protein